MQKNKQCWHSNGKLLLSGEYLVMHGARALALPINKGQSLGVFPNKKKSLIWRASHSAGLWFESELDLPSMEIKSSSNDILSKNLKSILEKTIGLKPEFEQVLEGKKVICQLDFLPEYGLGSSSTLISNLSNWAGINAYELLKTTFGGSGYDIACASRHSALIYQITDNKPLISGINFDPPFGENIYFAWLGKKQSSSNSIKEFKKKSTFEDKDIEDISIISEEMANCKSITHFMFLMNHHEDILSRILNKPKVKSLLFNDFQGSIKSLGAWGGDFVMIVSEMSQAEVLAYFNGKGIDTLFSLKDLIIDNMPECS